MRSKQEILNLWDNAPIQKFLDFSQLNAPDLKVDGLSVTEDWARALYLFEKYSGGGYMTSMIGVSRLWRFAQGRFNIPYSEQIAGIFTSELLYTHHHNRDVQTLLSRIARRIGNGEIDADGELSLILSVIEEKTGCKFEPCSVAEKTQRITASLSIFPQPPQTNLSDSNKDDEENKYTNS